MKSLLASALLLAAGLAAAVAQTVPPRTAKASAGFDYSRGSYGLATDTKIFSTTGSLSQEYQNWLFRGTVSHLLIDGPASVVGDLGPGRPGSAQATRTEYGIGDPTASATYRFDPTADGFYLELTGRVKFGVANENKGLGTGGTDLYTQADVFRSFGTVTPFATLGYRFFGNSPLYDLRDGTYFSLGSTWRTGPSTVLGLSYDWRQRIVAGADASEEGTVFVSQDLDDRWSLFAYLLRGFSDASPDVGGGASVAYKF